MAVVWGNFDDMVLYYMKYIGGGKRERVILFCKTLEKVYAVGTYAEYKECCLLGGKGMYRPVMSMTAEEFIGLMLARVNDIVEVAIDANDTESVQAGDKPGGESTGVDAGTDRERKGEDADGGGESEKAHKVVSEPGENIH